MLVSCKVKDGVPLFEVHKEGLMMLRKFRNKRLRIIFNITHNADHLQKFNEIFLDQANLQQSSTNFSTIHHQSESSNISQLIISQYYKQLSENRVIIFLNAYSNCGNPYLLVIGYLVASVFLYHNHENLSQDSYLTKLLSSLKHLLEATEVSELQKQIKFKSGCSKKPYFMCLFENFNEELFISELNFHDQFREFYKYHEGKHSLNESVDTLIDYFPQRSAIQIGDYTKLQQSKNRVKKLGQGYRSQILGRQIFNFEITGSSLQNLCFEMCEVFNSQTKSINLSKIYTKIINNQKTQVLDNLVQRYSKLTNDLEKQLPYEPGQLLESLTQIQKYIIQESIADSCNCMLFSQYQQIYNSLSKLMKKRFKSITESNKQLLSSRALTCFQQIEQDQQLDHSIRNTNEENATEILEVVQQKILIFIQENLHQFSTRDFLTRLINNLLEKYGEYIGNYMDKNLLAHKDLQQKVSKLELQNRTYQAKCQQLQNQYIYLNSINNQFKQKLLGSNGVPSNQAMSIGLNEAADSLIVYELKKKIIDLQMQINQKNQCIQSLAEVLDKFDLEFNRKYYKPKFSNNIQKLLSEVSHKINEIYTVLSELKKTQNFYEEIHHSMQQKKKQFYEVRDQEKIEQNNLKQKMNQVLKQKKILQQVVQQSKEAINNVNNVESEYKGSIDQLQNVCSRLKCSLADTEGELQKYKKALQLVSLYCMNGRIDKLRDFCKVTNDQELKQMLKPIIKK